MRRSLLPGLLAAATVAFPAAAQEPSRPGSISAKATVEKVLVDAYVVGPHGGAIAGLRADDLLLRVDGVEVPVEDLEYVPANRPEIAPKAPPAPAPAEEDAGIPEFPEGRLIVLFCQADIGRYRTKGLMRAEVELGAFLDRLLPTDRVAVLSYDSHLKLRLDFTNDRAAIRHALFDSLKIGGAPDPAPASPFPSLAAHFDVDAARKAASVERGLLVAAKALQQIPGGKVMFFLGWGLRVDRVPVDWKWHALAVSALQEARTNVFTLDVSDADWHTLETELMLLSETTGGTYAKTHLFTNQALDLAFRAIEGRYIVVFARPDGPRGRHAIDLTLRATKGRVLARPFYDDP